MSTIFLYSGYCVLPTSKDDLGDAQSPVKAMVISLPPTEKPPLEPPFAVLPASTNHPEPPQVPST